MKRLNISSGAPWEDIVGYSRAVVVGDTIEVSGTTAMENGKVVAIGSYYQQTSTILKIISETLKKADSGMSDVVRTRIYVCDISKWEEVSKAHGEYFKQIKPAATMVEVSRLIDKDILVEIEVTAKKMNR
mgnify:CR=1 FL=1